MFLTELVPSLDILVKALQFGVFHCKNVSERPLWEEPGYYTPMFILAAPPKKSGNCRLCNRGWVGWIKRTAALTAPTGTAVDHRGRDWCEETLEATSPQMTSLW